MANEKLLVGSLEHCDLPELNIEALHLRVDTGAKTSSLHVDGIEEFEKNGKPWVSFQIHPDYHNVNYVVERQAPVKSMRTIKSSNGEKERRYVIDTTMRLGPLETTIELTLTDRSGMTYLMLLGREAMKGTIIVDPEFKYLVAPPTDS